MALTKITANIIEDGAISTASLANTSITADKLAATLDLTGKTITVATATAGDNDTTVASTAFVSTAIANLADSAPETLNTLNELAAALGDDANFSTTVTNSIALKAPLASPTFTGTLTASGLVYPTSDGTNGQVLTTDGAGNLSFADSAGGVDGIVSSADATAITIDSSENVTFTGSGSFGSNVTALTSFNSTTGNDLRLNAGSVNRDIFLQVNGSTLMTIQGSTGNVGIGAAPQSAPYYNNDNPALTVQKASGNAILPIVAAANTSSAILHLNQSGNRYWRISALYGGALTFGGKQPGSGAAESEAMRIDSSGKVGIGTNSPTHQLDVEITATNTPTARFLNKGAITGYTNICAIDTYQGASVNHQYLVLSSGNGSAISDNEFNFRGDGNAYADGSWNGGGADYAEYFEWSDGNTDNEDRVGHTVSLINNKIKIAEAGETVIGVISGNPSVVGDDAWNSWANKYLKDDYGRYLRDENGHRTPNPDYDDTLTYVKREDRPEWDIVGLMGKLRIKTGQQTNPNWIKMRDISDEVEEWLVR